MDSVESVIIGIILFVIILNITASIWIIKDEGLNRFQVNVQMVLIWCLPVIGSAIIISLQWSHSSEDLKKDMVDTNSVGYIVPTNISSETGVHSD